MNRKTFVVFVIVIISFFAGFQFAEYNQFESNYLSSEGNAECLFLKMNNSVENSESCPFLNNREVSNKCPYLNENAKENKKGNLHNSIFHKSS